MELLKIKIENLISALRASLRAYHIGYDCFAWDAIENLVEKRRIRIRACQNNNIFSFLSFLFFFGSFVFLLFTAINEINIKFI
tara:strand:- start:103 stop:351 length:249 start_codon:yes stop_codon:yes gene_type:complete